MLISSNSSTASTSTGDVTKTDTTYKDDNMDIKITTGKTSDTTYYVADIQLSSADYLKTALAQNTYGTNITDTTSSIAQQHNAIFAINEESDRSVHYIVIVSDGRTSESSGLTLYEMAELMKSYGVTTAYNLDGGGSSTMYFNGQVINKPTHKRKQNLRKGGERYRLHRLLKNLLASTFSPPILV